MGRARRNPFRGLLDHMSEMNRMRELVEGGSEAGREEQPRTHATAWIPAVDIFARGEDLIIRVELAGVQREDIDITLSGGVLTLSGERDIGLDEDEVTFYARERYYGNFRRSMTLPEGVDEDDDLAASFKNGMLEITIQGGAVVAEPKRVQIRGESD